MLDVLVGPAGTGKTTSLTSLRRSWEHQHGPGSVVGLAPSAAAADVLADGLSIGTENTAKWLLETARTPGRDARIAGVDADLRRCASLGSVRARRLAAQLGHLQTERNRWVIQPGQLVIVDEASLAGTLTLDRLVTDARTAGAKVLLVGDPAQLSPIDAGGAFAMLCADRTDLAELTEAHRFSHAWERQASIRLRAGDPGVIETYTRHDRIRSGTQHAMLDTVYSAWAADTARGLDSLMIAADRDTVTALNRRARADRIRTGTVTAHGVKTADGAAGTGDRIITRRNDRTLRTESGSGWVKNGDTWTVQQTHRDGSVIARNDHGDHVRLPADYVTVHVELGYATTAHRAQGRTVDTAHTLIDPTTTREILYVAATRGRHTNTINVITDHDPDQHTQHGPANEHSVGQVIVNVLGNTGADTAAHAKLRRECGRDVAECRPIEGPEPPRRTSRVAGIHAGDVGVGIRP